MFSVGELARAAKGRLFGNAGNATVRGISIDTRSIRPRDAFIAIKGSNFDGHDFIGDAVKKGASCIIQERAKRAKINSAKISIIEVADTLKALADIANFNRRKFNVPVIAVTGSNGKTTAKEMIAHVLSGKFRVLKNEGTKNNQIGLPLTLVKLDGSYDIAVLEVGTSHFGEVEYLARICQPNVGIITNVGPSHLEYLRNLNGVFKEKGKLLKNLEKPHVAVLNADDSLLKERVFRSPGNEFVLGFGMKNNCDFSASGVRNINGRTEFYVNRKYKFTLNTPGYYNVYNALAAITVGRVFGMDYKDIIRRLKSFDFPKGRLKFVKFNKVNFIDDTYNSNPLSLSRALSTMANFKTAGRKIFVMGDMLELGSKEKSFHCRAGREAARCCDILIAVGKLSRLAARAAKGYRLDAGNIFTCGTIAQARKILFGRLSPKKGDLVLVKGSRLMKMEEIFRD